MSWFCGKACAGLHVIDACFKTLQFSVLGFVDATIFKWSYAMLVNLVVIFLIIAIMNTISSSGLPGRQKLDEKTSFQVFLERFCEANL